MSRAGHDHETSELDFVHHPGDAHDGVPAVRLDHVSKDFDVVHAVRGIDLTIRQGEIVAFLGPNGARKTSTNRPPAWTSRAAARSAPRSRRTPNAAARC